MSRIFVTGSTQGIGLQTVTDLVAAGHEVVMHARDEQKGDAAQAAVPTAAGVAVGDLGSLASLTALAAEVNELGPYDAVIHNAGLGGSDTRVVTPDGLSEIFAVNVLAPYVLTALVAAPARLLYLSSGLQAQGRVDLADLQYADRRWDGMQAYSDSKLYDVMLAFWVARQWPGVLSNAIDPGWIKTRMGGAGATQELPEGAETPVWLATADEPAATVSGRFLKSRQDLTANPAAYDEDLQDQLVARLQEISGVSLSQA